MPNVIIRQSPKRGSGVVIAVIILIVIGFAKYGPRLGNIQDTQDRERQQTLQRIMNSRDLERIAESLKESDAAAQTLENIRRAGEEQRVSEQADSQKAIPSNSGLERQDENK